MKQATDSWYVRLPDGRVLRANSTDSIKHHLNSGRIPLESRVRRSPDEEWSSLEWTSEFTEEYHRLSHPGRHAPMEDGRKRETLPRPVSIASRLDPLRLQTVGIRGAVEELLAALDSTMVRVKLRVAGVIGLLLGLALAIQYLLVMDRSSPATWWSWLIFGSVAVVLVALGQCVLTRMTYAEVSQLQPARWGDGLARLPGTWLNVALADLLVFGVAAGGLVALRMLPEQFHGWYLEQYGADGIEVARDVAGVGAFLGELLLWPVLGFALLLAPLVVVEDQSAFGALWQWLRLLGRYLGEVFLYQAVALSMGLMVALPLGLVLAIAVWGAASGGVLDRELRGVVFVLGGVALTPLFAYLVVANLFVYLHVRYEVAPRGK